MLLQRLVAYEPPSIPGFEDAALPPFFRERPMRWGLRITPDGRLGSPQLIDLANPADRQAKFGQPGPAPYLARAAGISPLLGADDLQYVLGWADEKSKPERVADCHAASIALVVAWAASAPDDPVAQACVRFFTDGHHHAVLEPEGWTSKQGVVLLVGADGHWVTEEPSLRAYWAREVQRRKAGGQGADGDGRSGICLVCGQVGVLVDRFPLQLPRRLVPGCSQASAALVSANKTIHTYDFTENLTAVPICLGCAQRSVANLEHLLDDSSHALACGDSRMTWWTIGPDFDLRGTVEDPDPQQIIDMVDRLHHGAGAVSVEDPDRFCSVTISGNTSRVMIRDWIDMPLKDLEANLATWFADHQVHGIGGSRGGYLPLVRLELATGRWIAARGGDGQAGEYARFDAKNAQRPDGVRRQLLQAAVKGVALPPSVFSHLLTRIRTDGHIDDPRAALLRLALVRRARYHPSDGRTLFVPGPGLDPDSHDPAYVAGRIFAQLETIQYYAARVGRGKEDRLNATFADRHLAGAIANPTIALIEGQKLAQPWLKKIGRGQPGVAVNLRRQLSDLFELLDLAAGLPGRAQLDEQARFILGYHHHRADSIRRGMAANVAKTSTPPPAGTPASAATPADDSVV
ncbi:type I-C CRISPR-associated protein Cas8c/Csd1 [Frankia gtarii]|uniref:type I-C CRISPR-associated protein Cas8c/Csd1 n=1 Tax=Frankia gtarii TaxID=2950102 RepID=UPI0021C175F6|nr:type I-C CRISPR-associated protein Cas8c/Csd1 [Frankia gtarii]